MRRRQPALSFLTSATVRSSARARLSLQLARTAPLQARWSIPQEACRLQLLAASHSRPDRLYVKNEGAEEDEIGLGISDESDHEINSTHFIQLDLSNLIGIGINGGILDIGSLADALGF